MPSFAEALYNLPTERLRQLVLTRRLDAKKLALIPNKKQLAQFVSVELGKPASVTEAILQCSARELRLLQLLLGVEGEQVMAWDSLLRAAGGGQELSAPLNALMTRLEELGLAFRVQDRRAQSKSTPARKTAPDADAAPGANAAAGEGKAAPAATFAQNAQEATLATGVWMPNTARQFVPASLSDRYTLERCLELYDAVSLKRICDTLELPQDTKPVNVAAVKKRLLGDAARLNLPRPLTEDEVSVLEYVVQSGGSATAIEVATAALDNQTEDFFRYDWQNRWKQGKSRNAVDTLLARGLLYVVSYGYGYNLFLLIPGDLLRVLSGDGDRGFWTMPAPAPAPLAEPPPRTALHAGLLRDVVALLGFMSAQDASRTNTGSIHKTSLKNMMRGLSLPEDRYAGFLYAVCREAKLIDTVGEKMVYKITATGNSWLHWDGVAQTRALVEAWRKGSLWGEMYGDPLHKSSDYRSAEAVQRIRGAALSIIAEAKRQDTGEEKGERKKEKGTEDTGFSSDLTTNNQQLTTNNTFYDLTSVVETLTFRYPLLLGNSAAYGADLVPSPANFVRLLAGECLYWLGLAELAEPAPSPSLVNSLVSALPGAKGAVAEAGMARGATGHKPILPEAIGYRLTPMGAFLLGVEGASPPEAAPREDHFIVQANGEIFVSPYLEPATLYHLLAMTETPAKGATGNTVSLTRESIRRCLDQGEQPRDVLAFLQTHARTGIPQNVEYLINDVGGKHGHIRLGRAQMYVQVDTPLLLRELQARKEIKPYFVRTLSDTVALLNSDDPDKLMRELRKAGYLPISDDDKPQSMLTLKTKPAPPPAPVAVSADPKAAKRAARADASIQSVDWARIAQDDDKPYNDGKQSTTTAVTLANVTRNQTLIKTLLIQASKMRRVVEIEYLEQGTPVPARREIQPTNIIGAFVTAYDRMTGEPTNFNIARIQWARLTDEIFE